MSMLVRPSEREIRRIVNAKSDADPDFRAYVERLECMKSGFFGRFIPRSVAAAGDPSTILGAALIAWYRGDSLTLSSTDVTQLTDKSGNGNHLVPASVSPTYSATGGPNSTPMWSSTGTTQVMQKTSGITGFPGTGGMLGCFVVASTTGTANNIFTINVDGGFRLSWDVSNTIDIRFASAWGGDSFTFNYGTSFHKFVMFQQTSNFKCRVDGVEKYSVAHQVFGTTSTTSIKVQDQVISSMPEICFWSGDILASQAVSLESYSTTRYGI